MAPVAHARYIREKARSLRIERGLTIDELALRLALPRSTIYCWVRDLPIPGSGPGGGWPEKARRNGNRAMQRKYRLLREAAYRQGWDEYERLSGDPTFRDFVCLYVAEGYKRRRNTASLSNSDPAVVGLAHRWMQSLTDKRLFYSLQYHADQDLAGLCAFWGASLCVDPGQVRAQRKSNSNQLTGRSWRSRYGVLEVRVYDTALRARIQAWIDRVRCDWQ